MNTSSFLSAWQFALSKRALMVARHHAIHHHRDILRIGGTRPSEFGALAAVQRNFDEWIVAFSSCSQLNTSSLGLIVSLYATGIMTLLSFAFKSLRFLSFSCLIHMVFVGLSLGLFLLVPHPFLNWLFD